MKEKLTEVTRGLANLKTIAANLKNDELVSFLNSGKKVFVHSSCRKRFTERKTVWAEMKKIEFCEKLSLSPPKLKLRRSSDSSFDWEHNCFICNQLLVRQKKVKQHQNISVVTSYHTKQKLIDVIKNTRDKFSRSLLLRINSVNDLRSVSARYHRSCYANIMKPANTPEKTIDPRIMNTNHAMDEIIDYINNHPDCQFSLNELMKVVSGNSPAPQTIKHRLEEYYAEDLVVSNNEGQSTLFCFKKKHHDILNESFVESHLDAEHENIRKIKEVANIIYKDICNEVLINDHYPAGDQMFSKNKLIDVIPQSLRLLLSEIIPKSSKKQNFDNELDKKTTSIAHAIMSAVRPRSFLSPLQVGLSVTLHRKFGSRKVIDICHALGFCASYHEAQLYEASALYQDSAVLSNDPFVQFVFDNADFNTATLTGAGTFHNLGGISIVTPAASIQPRQSLPRLKSIPREEDIAEIGEIKVETYMKPGGEGLRKIIAEVQEKHIELKPTYTTHLNTLWMFMKNVESNNYLGWNAFMQNLTTGLEYEQSKIVFLPFINSNPSDYNTLFTAIRFAIYRARSIGMNACVITFDQPLYMKAQDIVSAVNLADDLTVIIKLGAFHMMLSFLGCIGNIMAGSGLKEALSTVYADKTCDQILSGHNYSRAVRAHSLVQLALSKIIFEELKSDEKFAAFQEGFKDSSLFYSFNYTEIRDNETFKNLIDFFENKLLEIEERGKTCKLWITYFRMVSLLKDFIAAERMGDWELHLRAVELMIPFFHAARHFPYAKCSEIYLQKMRTLPQELSQEDFEAYKENHSARRSDKYFTKISTDQTIEQTLMKSMKIEGGPFRRGATPSVVFKWIRATLFTTDVVDGMEEFCGVSFKSSYQHIDASDSRINEDSSAVYKIAEFFHIHNPFPDVQEVMAISTGIVGNETIDCYKAFDIGINLRKKMKGLNFKDIKMTIKDTTKSLLSMSSKIKVNNTAVAVDPNLIFQRLCFLRKSNDELRQYFNYELAPYPLSLFDNAGMRKTTKSTLYDIFEQCETDVNDVTKFFYIIDGGMLLHRLKWEKNQKFIDIFQQYIRYLRNNYGTNVKIVFDGYNNDGTKASERNRRYISNTSIDYFFEEDMPLNTTKEKFLGNSKNKNRFINLFCKKLAENNIEWSQAESDADRLIVQSALDSSFHDVVVVAEDIDVLVILMALAPDHKEIFFLKPVKNNVLQRVYSTKTMLIKYPNITKNHLFFIHAFTGCDTTSAFYNKGKNNFIKIFNNDQKLRAAAETFMIQEQSEEILFNGGIYCILTMYGAKTAKNLNELRYKRFIALASKDKSVQLSSLPPTEDAAKQHIKRVYLQVQQWKNNALISPEDWGWQLDNYLKPIKMTQPAAPMNVLKIIFCSCKTGCGSACGCRKSGLHCSPACIVCSGSDCDNHPPLEEDEVSNTQSNVEN